MEQRLNSDRGTGSGITSRAIVAELKAQALASFAKILNTPQFSGRNRATAAAMSDAFVDGMSTMVSHLESMGVITFVEEDEVTEP